MKFDKPKDAQKIGEGRYKHAFRSTGESPNRVWLELKHHYTPQQTKSIFYLNNIIHLLFPDHTIRIEQAGVRGTNKAHVVSEYVSTAHDSLHQQIQISAIKNSGQPMANLPAQRSRYKQLEESKEINDFIDQCEEAGLRDNFAAQHTWGPQDIIFEENGNFRFVDIDPAWENPEDVGHDSYTKECLRFDPLKLQVAIKKLPPERQKQAQELYNRLLDLCREVGFDL